MEKKVIKMSEILADLDNGLTRSEIKTKYELTGREMASLFSHPSLKSRKPKKKLELSFIFEEDVVAETSKEESSKEEVLNTEIVTKQPIEATIPVETDFTSEYPTAPVENTEVDPFDL